MIAVLEELKCNWILIVERLTPGMRPLYARCQGDTLSETRLHPTFRALNEAGPFSFANAFTAFTNVYKRRLAPANEPKKQGLFVCKFVCDILYVNLYVFGISVPARSGLNSGLDERHPRINISSTGIPCSSAYRPNSSSRVGRNVQL